MTAKQQKGRQRPKQGVKDGETASTDKTRRPDRPVNEEDVFGGAERVRKGKDVESPATKP